MIGIEFDDGIAIQTEIVAVSCDHAHVDVVA
jgi:hypothetical protein